MNDELKAGNYGWPIHRCRCGGEPELIVKGTEPNRTYAFACEQCGRRTEPRRLLAQAGEDWDLKRMHFQKSQPDLSHFWWNRI